MKEVKMNISDIDKNFQIISDIKEPDIKFYGVCEAPFSIYGLYKPSSGSDFSRIPAEVAEKTSKGVSELNKNTAGGRIRFKTDSEYVAINVTVPSFCVMPHMTMAGSSGFDMYEKTENGYVFLKTFYPWEYKYDANGSMVLDKTFERIIYFEEKRMRDLIINFPLYNPVSKVYVGLNKNAGVFEGGKYRDILPIVYYGSSITQGGCASRPGMSYADIISRRYDIDYINLGFSGNAKGESAIAEYIAGLPMSVFVYDYDHNAPNVEHLRNTHKPMFDIIRKKNPDLPIIIASRPKYYLSEDELVRRNMIYETYISAKNANDDNVYFVDGQKIFEFIGYDDCTVDGTHPTDLGFMCMAKAFGEIIEKLLVNITDPNIR